RSARSRLWDVAREVSSLAFSPDGKLLATAYAGASQEGVHLWRVRSGELVSTPYKGDSDVVAFSPDGKLLATSARQGINLWEVPSGRHHAVLIFVSSEEWGLVFQPHRSLGDYNPF